MNTYWICEEYDIEGATAQKCLEATQEYVAEEFYDDPDHTSYSPYFLNRQDTKLEEINDDGHVVKTAFVWVDINNCGFCKGSAA